MESAALLLVIVVFWRKLLSMLQDLIDLGNTDKDK